MVDSGHCRSARDLFLIFLLKDAIVRRAELSNWHPCVFYDALDAHEPALGVFRTERPRPAADLGSGVVGAWAVSPIWLTTGGGPVFSHSSISIWPIVGSTSVPSRETLISR